MAEQAMHIDMVEVKPEDIIGDRRATYASFIRAATVSIVLTVVFLAGLYLLFG
jgi:hypothetical protein